MKVLGRDRLAKFSASHADAKTALDAWFHEVGEAHWATSQEIKARYASASFLADNRVFFNIKGNHYRLAVLVPYSSKIVAIDWIGTQAEYDKKRF